LKSGSIAALRDLVNQRTKALSDQALQSGGRVPPDDAEDLARLGRLLDLAERGVPKRRPLWPPALVFVCTLGLVSMLAFGRTGRTEIVLDLQADEIGFRVPSRQILLESVALSHIGISGDTFVDLPETSGSFRRIERTPVNLVAVSGGSVELSGMTVGAGTQVSIQYAGAGRQFRISQRGEESAHRISVSGQIEITGADPVARRMDFHVPRPIRVQGGKQGVDFDVTLAAKDTVKIISNLRVSALEFMRLDEMPGPEGTAIRQRSTLRGGTLYFESLNGRAQPLRPGELLRLQGTEGEIRVAELKPDLIALQFHGWVTGIATGSLDDPTPLMPTWLEWLKERKGLYLIWGTALYLFGLAAAFLRWLRIEL
jgi:hypothetical protein